MLDKINKLYDSTQSIYERIKMFFEEMKELSEQQKEERIDLSKKIVEVMRNIEALVHLMKEWDAVDQRIIKDQLVAEYGDLVSDYVDLDAYMTDYLDGLADDVIKPEEEEKENEIEIDDMTVLFVALEGAQTVLNYQDFQEAKKNGKTTKTWKAFSDRRTRKSHEKLSGKTISIDEYFVVGDVLMRFPHDWQYAGGTKNGLRQLVNCRCVVIYK